MNYTTSSLLSLISHIHTLTQDFTNRRLSEKGDFVSSHGFILFLLSTKEKMTMGEITQLINRNKSTTTVLIRKLSDEGLIKIEPSTEDSRIKFISLTEEGKKYNSFTSDVSKQLLDVCFKNFTEEEKNTLLQLLIKTSENLSSNGAQ